MKKWINENGGPLIVTAALVGIAVGGFNYLGQIRDGISENRNEIREIREELGNDIEKTETELRNEQRETREELRNEQRETREELRSEIRENRNAIGVNRDAIDALRLEMNNGFVRVNESVEENEDESIRRIDAVNGRIDDVNGLNIDTNRRIDELSGQINSRSDPADVEQSSGEDASGS